ncbi:N-acetylmuramoyl-L-alanine amidase [Nonomuraea sp. NPDC050310]|uniref:N-acetylmuramoyl-L-alanine amidase n=1 Tax=unclassified Nonomuraea TaxID=2593643 RepID=UPI0034082179
MSSVLVVALVSSLLHPTHPPLHPTHDPGRQDDFVRAAARYEVPPSLLLAVSYLESRWDANAGLPSASGGYGPMHLLGPVPAGEQEDRRGDDARPLAPAPAGVAGATLAEAARLTGLPPERLREDPVANIRGGAAVLAAYRAAAGGWYEAAARYGGSRAFADEVFEVLRTGAERVTDDGHPVRLAPNPKLAPPPPELPMRTEAAAAPTECPSTLACEWMPAAYARFGKKNYGNHDRVRGRERRIDYIVIHDTEGSYRGIPSMVGDPKYVSWHYSIRSRDGHVAQHVATRDIAWHAGNWDVNSRSIGIEHEAYLAKGPTWFTEAMYRSSARLVRYLADRYDIPLDRAHILGHDNVPGTNAKTLAGMHEDPGPFWDWERYFALLRSPLKAASGGGSVLIKPDYPRHAQTFTGCAKKKPCPARGYSTVWLRTEPRGDAPLVDDIGKGGPTSTYSVYDHSARASAGQRFAVAETRGDWTAIWYLGRKAWFYNPAAKPTAVRTGGPLVVPRRDRVPVYGRAYPERSAFPSGVGYQRHIALPYVLRTGQAYSLGLTVPGSYFAAGSFNPARHVLVRGRTRYHQIQLGHRVVFVKAKDVRVVR